MNRIAPLLFGPALLHCVISLLANLRLLLRATGARFLSLVNVLYKRVLGCLLGRTTLCGLLLNHD